MSHLNRFPPYFFRARSCLSFSITQTNQSKNLDWRAIERLALQRFNRPVRALNQPQAREIAALVSDFKPKKAMPSIKEKASRPAKPQPDPLRKLSFGAINRKANNAKTAYPVLPDPNGQLAIIVVMYRKA